MVNISLCMLVMILSRIVCTTIIQEDGYVTGLYYAEWSYFLHHLPSDIPLSSLTNIYYAFLKINDDELTLHFSNEELATKSSLPFRTGNLTACITQKPSSLSKPDRWLGEYMQNVSSLMSNGDDNIQSVGLIGQLSQIKNLNPNIRISLSVGGSDTTDVFKRISKSPKSMQRFVDSLLTYMQQYGFDGIDLDWEYPDKSSTKRLTKLIQLIREQMDLLSSEGGKYVLTVPIPSYIDMLDGYEFDELSKFVTYFNLMGYDMSGIWSKRADFQSQLYRDVGAVDNSDRSVNDTVEYLINVEGVDPKMIILGMPAYGLSFKAKNLHDKAAKCADLSGIKQDPEECIVGYNKLPPDGYNEYFDDVAGVAYALNGKDGVIVYDNELTARMKARYVKTHGLAGGLWWDSSGDTFAANSTRSLLFSFVDELGGLEELKVATSQINPKVYHGDFSNQTYNSDEFVVGSDPNEPVNSATKSNTSTMVWIILIQLIIATII